MQHLERNTRTEYGGAAVSNANNTDSNSTIFDTAGADAVRVFTTITDCAQNGVATLKIEENTANSDSGMALATGATVSATSASNDDLNGKVLEVTLVAPFKRYIQAVRVSATANIAFGEVYVQLISNNKKPVGSPTTAAATPVIVAGA